MYKAHLKAVVSAPLQHAHGTTAGFGSLEAANFPLTSCRCHKAEVAL